MRRRFAMGLLVVGFATVWIALDCEQESPLPLDPSSELAQQVTPTLASATTTTAAGPDTVETMPPRFLAPTPTAATKSPAAATAQAQVVVELRGLHPAVPWTAPLVAEVQQLFLDDLKRRTKQRLEARVENGRATFSLADSMHRSDRFIVTAQDPSYRSIDRLYFPSQRHVVIDVEPIASLHGRVVDDTGKPLHRTRVFAFSLESPGSERHALDSALPDWRGRFELHVPPNTEMLVMAIPVQIMLEAGETWDYVPDLALLGHTPNVVKARSSLSSPATTPDLVLAKPSLLRGVVRTPEGRPWPYGHVRMRAENATNLVFTPDRVAQLLPDGRVLNCLQVPTDENGEFTLPAPHGPLDGIELVVTTNESMRVVQPLVVRPSSATEIVTLELPLPTRLRAKVGGTLLQVTELQFEGRDPELVPHLQWVDVVANARTRVRLMHSSVASQWHDLGPADGGRTIDLELSAEHQDLPGVLLRFGEGTSVTQARVQWRAADGSCGEVRGHAQSDNSIPVRLPAGRYRLTVHCDQHGPVLPSEHDVEVTATTAELFVPLVPGGRFFVCAVDSRGRHGSGKVTVKDARGADVTGTFRHRHSAQVGGIGQLLPGGPNDLVVPLPVGDYELLLEFDDIAPIRERVRITAGGDARVDVRLP